MWQSCGRGTLLLGELNVTLSSLFPFGISENIVLTGAHQKQHKIIVRKTTNRFSGCIP